MGTLTDVKSIQAITFDCYGTLIDWESGIIDILQPILRRNGIDRPNNEILDIYSQIEPRIQKTPPFKSYKIVLESVMNEFGNKFNIDLSKEETEALWRSIGSWLPFDDVGPAILKMKGRLPIAIITNIDEELFLRTSEQLPIQFDMVVTAESVMAYKPSELPFKKMLSMLDMPPERVLHVAESPYHDIIPARSFRMNTVLIERPKRYGTGATPTIPCEPDFRIQTLTELPIILGL
jgi:2-haloacid dehalogenase